MQNAVWLSTIFGPMLVILGLWMVLYHDNLLKVVNAVKASPGLLYIVAVVNLLVGLGILSWYNDWTFDLEILVTLLGWLTLIRAVLLLFVPQVVIKITMTKHKYFKQMGVVPLVWGLLLCWLGFFTY